MNVPKLGRVTLISEVNNDVRKTIIASGFYDDVGAFNGGLLVAKPC